MSAAMELLNSVSCALIGGGLALAPERPRHSLLRGLIAGTYAFGLHVAVRAVAS